MFLDEIIFKKTTLEKSFTLIWHWNYWNYILANIFISIECQKFRTRKKIRLWSEAIKKKAELVRLTNLAFEELAQNETKNVYLWARATKEFQKSLNDFGLALEIIQNNDNIPLILTNNEDNIFLIKTLNF